MTSAKRRETATEQIGVTIGREQLKWARQRAKRLRKSLSSVLTDALREQQQLEARRRLLERLGGTEDISAADLEQTWREWQGL